MTANRLIDVYSQLSERPVGTLIYRPGYTGDADDIKSTWSEVKSVIDRSSGGLTIVLDSTYDYCHVTETTNCFGKINFTGSGNNPIMIIEDGVQLIDPGGFNGVQVFGAPTIVSSILMTMGGAIVAERGGGFGFAVGATLPLIDNQAPFGVFARYLNGAYDVSNAPTVPLIRVATGSTTILVSIDCGLANPEPNTLIDGDPTSVLLYGGDANSFFTNQTMFSGFKLEQRLDKSAALIWSYGDTASRPTNAVTGQPYFDTDLGSVIWWNGSEWITSNIFNEYLSNTSSNPGNDTNDIEILSTTIPTNSLIEGSIYELESSGRIDVSTTVSTLDWWIKINGTKTCIISQSSAGVANTNLPWTQKSKISFRNLGATTDVLVKNDVTSFIDGSTYKVTIVNNYASLDTVDSTSSNTISFGFSWQTADPDNITHVDEADIKKIR